jgi:hypothetical protein
LEWLDANGQKSQADVVTEIAVKIVNVRDFYWYCVAGRSIASFLRKAMTSSAADIVLELIDQASVTDRLWPPAVSIQVRATLDALELAGQAEMAERIAMSALNHGDHTAGAALVAFREEHGDRGNAAQLLRKLYNSALQSPDMLAQSPLPRMLISAHVEADDLPSAEAVAAAVARAGSSSEMWHIVSWCEDHQRWGDAKRLALLANNIADDEKCPGLETLAAVLRHTDGSATAERLLAHGLAPDGAVVTSWNHWAKPATP